MISSSDTALETRSGSAHPDTLVTWSISAMAVVIISFCGLIPIICMPKIQQKSYHHDILQFLIGLAIGTLTGDALLHLLPHSVISDCNHGSTSEVSHPNDQVDNVNNSQPKEADHHDNEHSKLDHHEHAGHRPHDHSAFLFGLMALVGIIGFLALERIVIIVTDLITNIRRASKIDNCQRSTHYKIANVDGDNCKHDLPAHSHEHDNLAAETEKLAEPADDALTCGVINQQAGNSGAIFESKPNVEHHQHSPSSFNCLINKANQVIPKGASNLATIEQCHRETIFYPDPEKGVIVQLTDHHHHHHHQHQHSNKTKSFIYMIVTGDGLHNFFDGLAIGVAFVGSIAGGLSTSIAILCHELPHEIGDFAVLIKSGMTIRRAVICNTMSSLLCLLGATLGVFLGKIDVGWVSALVAGMFLYIALVDMVPQLDCCPTQSGSSRAKKLSIQLAGIAAGVTIMSLISIYESRFHGLIVGLLV